MPPLVDEILNDQSKLLPGDILIFYGRGHNRAASVQGMPLSFGQFFMHRGGWSRKFLHTAMCLENQNGLIKIGHIKDTSVCEGVALVEERDIKQSPFNRSFIIIRPPDSIRHQSILKLQEGIDTGVRTTKKAYFKTLFGHSRPIQPTMVNGFNKNTTCSGFIVNVLQLIYQNEAKQPFPLTSEIATARLLKHMQDLKLEKKLTDWSFFFVPVEGHSKSHHIKLPGY